MKRSLCLMLSVLLLLLILPIQPAKALPIRTDQKQELAEKVAQQVVAGMPSWVDTDEEKVRYLFNYIIGTVSYASNPDDQTPYSALVLRQTVCAGYAKGLALLLNTAGIEAGTVSGRNLTTNLGHEWTYFYLGGIKLYADPTWADAGFSWSQIEGKPHKQINSGVIRTEKMHRKSHAEYIFLDGVYDGSGSDAGSEYSYINYMERSGAPVGRFNRDTKPEEVLPYFQVLYYDGTNAMIRVVYHYDEGENDYLHTFAVSRAAEMYLDSVTDSFEIAGGDEGEVYYFGPLAGYEPTPAQSVVLRTAQDRESRVGEPFIVTAEVYPYEASNKRVTYSSSDPSVATVDQYGTVVGKKEGTVVITATSVDGGHTDSVEVTIVSDHYHDSWLENIFEKAPTCEEPGCKMYFRCRSCGAWFPDYWGSAEIVDHNSWLIPALGHAESGWLADGAGHWKQCTRSNCGKLTQTKTAHSDSNGDGACDVCTFKTGGQTPTQPTQAPTKPTEGSIPTTVPATTVAPTTVPAGTNAPTKPTAAPTGTAAPQPTSVPATNTAPAATPQAQEPSGGAPVWILGVVLGAAALIPAGIVLLRRRKR